MKIFKEYLLFFLFSFSFGSFMLNGNVTDYEGNPIENVNIHLLNTGYGTVTNNAGNFSINILEPIDAQLQASHIGYEVFIDKIGIYEDFFLNVKLKKDVIDMKDIVITGTKNETYIKDSPV